MSLCLIPSCISLFYQIFMNIARKKIAILHLVPLILVLPTKVFDSFMYCHFVLRKTSLWSCLIVALSAKICNSFIFYFYSLKCCHFVRSQKSLCSCLIVTLSASIFDSFMYSTFVLSHTSLYSCLIVTLPARIFDAFMVWWGGAEAKDESVLLQYVFIL